MNTFRIEHTEYLYALGVIPLLALLFFVAVRQKKKAMLRAGDFLLIRQMMPGVSRVKPLLKFILLLLAFTFLVAGISNPQIGSKLEEVKRQGADLMIALDVSNSMKAEDISPNRLERAKQAIGKLINQLEGDRIGLIVFAGEAFVQLPITTDYSAAKLFLETIDTDIVPTQGTSIGSAIELAMESFGKEDGHNKAIILITDGENHEQGALEAAKNAVEKGIYIHTIGMGSVNGTPIPLYRNGVKTGFRKDREGNTVVTKLNENMLQQLSSTGNGVYIRAASADVGLNKILDEVKKLDKKEFKSKIFTDYDDKFYIFLSGTLFLLVLEELFSERKSEWIEKLNLFGEKKNA